MTGLHRRTGWSILAVRLPLEVTVVVLGWFLGGVVGIGTILYAVGIGPMVQVMLPLCIVELDGGRRQQKSKPSMLAVDPPQS